MKTMTKNMLAALGFASAFVVASSSAEAREPIKHVYSTNAYDHSIGNGEAKIFIVASQASLANEIILENFGAFDQIITVYDQKCNEVAYSNLFVAAGSEVTVELCRDSFTEYSSFVVDRVNAESGNPIGILHFSLVSDGEKKTF